ncbi:MAG: MBL fold metallo-hydrolase [Pseudomonadota bacterium]
MTSISRCVQKWSVFVGFFLVAITSWAKEGDQLHSYQQALKIVQDALENHGGIERLRESGVTIELQGTFDLAARFQGRSASKPEPTPIKEWIAMDLVGNNLAYDIDWFNYFSSNQKLREIYDSEGRLLFLDHRTKVGGYLPRETVVDAQLRLARVLPNLLLADALKQRKSLRNIGESREKHRSFHRVSYSTTAGNVLTLWIDKRYDLLSKASAIIDMPLLGDAQIEWYWDEYNSSEDLRLPNRYQVYLSGTLMKNVAMSVGLGTKAEDFLPPDDYSVFPPPESLSPLSDYIPYGAREPVVDTLSAGVYMVRDLRSGFRLLFVEFEEFALAVDAPSGWYEMQQIPPMNWSYGDGTSDLGEKYLRAIKATIPDKPLKYLVLTHHHSDHIGGLRPFLSKNVEILAGENAAKLARQASKASHSLDASDNYGSDHKPNITIVKGLQIIKDRTMAVQLIELPDGNPKADNYLMVYLPKQKLLYSTAFIYPVPESAFPPPESINLSVYFVQWLDRSGLDVEQIYNVHAGGLVEEWQLEKLRHLATEL